MAECNRPDSDSSSHSDPFAGGPNLQCSNNCTKKRGAEFDDDSAMKKTRAEEEGAEKAHALLGGQESRAAVFGEVPKEGSSMDSHSQVRDDSVSDLPNGGGSREEDTHNQSIKDLEFVIDAAVADDKGSRHTMEDAWVVLPDANLEFPAKLRFAHFAIYDGHGGRLAAEYAKKHLHANVLSAGLPLGCKSY